MKMEPDTIYRASLIITVNEPELRRIQHELELQAIQAARTYARIENLIKQGTIPKREGGFRGLEEAAESSLTQAAGQ